MIEKGLPGAGNIMLFDNGLFPKHRSHNGQTFIIELDPVTAEKGSRCRSPVESTNASSKRGLSNERWTSGAVSVNSLR